MNLRKIKYRCCSLADKEHKESKRQYCHVGHYKNRICYALEFGNLSIGYRTGLIAHEIGHLLLGNKQQTEAQADQAANEYFGIHIGYRSSKFGKEVEWLNETDWTIFVIELDAKGAFDLLEIL